MWARQMSNLTFDTAWRNPTAHVLSSIRDTICLNAVK